MGYCPQRKSTRADTGRVKSKAGRRTFGCRPSSSLLADLDRPMRASLLELTAHRLGCRSLAAQIAGVALDRPWQTRWSHGRRATGHQMLTGHDGAVRAVAAGVLKGGIPVLISGDGTVRMWRLADDHPVGKPLDLSESVRAVAVHGNIIVTVVGTDIAVHQLTEPEQDH